MQMATTVGIEPFTAVISFRNILKTPCDVPRVYSYVSPDTGQNTR